MLLIEILNPALNTVGKSYLGSNLCKYTVAEHEGDIVLVNEDGHIQQVTFELLAINYTEIKFHSEYVDKGTVQFNDTIYYPDIFYDRPRGAMLKYDGFLAENCLIDSGLAFTSEEDAKQEWRFLTTLTKIKKYANEANKGLLNWNDPNQPKYFIAYDFVDNSFLVDEVDVDIRYPFEAYFINSEDCKECIVKFKKELEIILMKGGK